MTRTFITLSLIITILALRHNCLGQSYYVGDILTKTTDTIQLKTTKEISPPFISFKEKEFEIKVSKADLLKSMNQSLTYFKNSEDEDFTRLYTKAINFISTNKNLYFDHLWSGWLESENFGWKEAEKAGNRMLTRQLLREHLCELIDAGKFNLIENQKTKSKYFFQRVDSNYGGNVKGVFSQSNKMIWICYPFVID